MLIDILQRRASIIDIRTAGPQLVLIFMRDGKQISVTLYSAGVDVVTMRELLL